MSSGKYFPIGEEGRSREKEKSKERMINGAKGMPILAEAIGAARDKVAEQIGVGHTTFEKAVKVFESDNEELKEKVCRRGIEMKG